MAKLPKTSKPLFDLFIPSQDRNVKARPFLVKEEKILLMAYESSDPKDIVLALKQIINNCVEDDKFDVDDLAMFDLEFMFLKLRARSVSNIVKLAYRDEDDGQEYNFEVNLDQVEITKPVHTDRKIMLSDDIGIIMKWPSITIIDDMPVGIKPLDAMDYLISKCIDTVFDEENVYPASECSEEEIAEFLGELDIDSFGKVKEFFDGLPEMVYEIKYTNRNKKERSIKLTTLSDFFTLG